MTSYLLRRLSHAVIVVFLVTIFVFLLLHLLPGGPARAVLGQRATPRSIALFNQQNGLNKPIYIQYMVYLDHLLHGNLGFSYKLNEPVTTVLAQYVPKSILLVGTAYLLALIIAIPLGIFQSIRRNTIADYFFTAGSFIFYSMPAFWLGLLLILYFAVNIHLFPAEAPQGATLGQIISNPAGLVLPVITIALITVALFSRYMRSSMMENLTQDYVRTAKAKGLNSRQILFGHVLRNALIPIITLIGLSLPTIFQGALITESVFNYPGVGFEFISAAIGQDYPVLLGFTLMIGIASVVGSLLADILYAVVDPRVRYGKGTK